MTDGSTGDEVIRQVLGPVDQIRRIQFDIERRRPATLVGVPEHPRNQPQVLSIPREQYAAAGEAFPMIGQRLAED
jgi:hypothetical protein